LGQTIAEVEAIMGGPPTEGGNPGVFWPLTFRYATPSEERSHRVKQQIIYSLKRIGLRSVADRVPWPEIFQWPVTIIFGPNGQVISIAIDGKEFNP
jgi:hypothetical protein